MLKLNVGHSRKIGETNFGSRGAVGQRRNGDRV